MNINKYNALLPISFEWDGGDGIETIEIKAKRASFGLAVSKQTREAIENQDGEGIAVMLSKLIDSWNLDADGEPFPPTPENITALPIEFASTLAEKVLAILSPNPTSANDSPNGSEPAESSLAASTTVS